MVTISAYDGDQGKYIFVGIVCDNDSSFLEGIPRIFLDLFTINLNMRYVNNTLMLVAFGEDEPASYYSFCKATPADCYGKTFLRA